MKSNGFIDQDYVTNGSTIGPVSLVSDCRTDQNGFFLSLQYFLEICCGVLLLTRQRVHVDWRLHVFPTFRSESSYPIMKMVIPKWRSWSRLLRLAWKIMRYGVVYGPFIQQFSEVVSARVFQFINNDCTLCSQVSSRYSPLYQTSPYAIPAENYTSLSRRTNVNWMRLAFLDNSVLSWIECHRISQEYRINGTKKNPLGWRNLLTLVLLPEVCVRTATRFSSIVTWLIILVSIRIRRTFATGAVCSILAKSNCKNTRRSTAIRFYVWIASKYATTRSIWSRTLQSECFP